ncbi:MAG: class I SAM-dependent methyltransferase [Promethearchaeia archaeon]
MKNRILFPSLLESLIKDCESILDLGCGNNSILSRIKKKKFSVGIDIFEKYIEISKKKKIHDKYFCYDILKIDEIINPKSFDCILLIDVIEHLEKKDGLKLILKMNQIAKKKIIITTPNGFLPQREYHQNPYQIHRSGWDIKTFKKFGFKIYGYGGLKILKGERAKIKFKPQKLGAIISIISTIFLKYCPFFSYHLCCVKEIN